MSHLERATGLYESNTKEISERNFKVVYEGYHHDKIGFCQTPLTRSDFHQIYNKDDFYVFVKVNPKNSVKYNNYDWEKKLLEQKTKSPGLELELLTIDFEQFIDPKNLTATLNKIYCLIKNKQRKSIIFISNDGYQHSSFVFGCFLSFTYPDKDEYDIFKLINEFEDSREDLLDDKFLNEDTKKLMIDFIHANNVRYQNFLDNDTKTKRLEEEIKKKKMEEFDKHLDESIEKIAKLSGLNYKFI